MCGICGIIKFNNSIEVEKLLAMTKVLQHRGPDDEGYILADTYKDTVAAFHHDDTIDKIKQKTPRLENNLVGNIGIGFKRLSILDLSSNGHQPMHFKQAGLWIVFNGEVYNYLELRDELKLCGYNFNSGTDTEVILKAYHKWGEECLQKFDGMWAFAIWDQHNKKLFCSRDRFGVKPFYYSYEANSHFIFASEIKSILQVIKSKPNKQTLFDSFAEGATAYNERTFFENIKQLRPGNSLILMNGKLSVTRYYDIKSVPCQDSFKKAKEKIKELLFDAVKLRLRSDVPIGYALSGGIDSSSIVGLATKIVPGSNNIFSMIYPGENVDESFFIKKVIEKTGADYHFVTPKPEDFIQDLDDFIWCQEEPFQGTSYFGEYKLRELVKKEGVTVCLEGQGADEIITGYTSLLLPYFFDLIAEYRVIKFLSEYIRFNRSISNPARILNAYLKRNNKLDNKYLEIKYPYLNFEYFSQIEDSTAIPDIFNSGSYLNDALYKMLFYDSIPEQLIRADKNSMAFSVECRFPFLDYRLVEYAINLPYEYKIKNGFTKYILRESIKDLLPVEVYNRKDKIGFAMPDNRFSTSYITKHFHELLSNLKAIEIPFLNKPKFMDEYFSKSDEKLLDWKFWKVASTILWYNKFFD